MIIQNWCRCFLFILILSILFIALIAGDDYTNVSLTLTSPLNGSIVGPLVELNFMFDFIDASNLRVNPSHITYFLNVSENGNKVVNEVELTLWSVQYSAVGSGWRILDCSVAISDSKSATTYVVRQSIEVFVVRESQYNLFPFDRTVRAGNDALVDIVSSISSSYTKKAVTVAIAIDNRDILYESMMGLSPTVLEVFDWSGVVDGVCQSAPMVKVAARHVKWHNVGCDSSSDGGGSSSSSSSSSIVYRAHYDVSVLSLTSMDGESSTDRLTSLVEYVRVMCHKTLGHLVLIISDKLLSLILGPVLCLSKPAQVITLRNGSTVLVYYKPSLRRLSESSGPVNDLASSWNLLEYQKLHYLVINNGCLLENGNLVMLMTPDEFAIENVAGKRSLHSVLDSFVFLPFHDFFEGTWTGGSNIRYINASAALVRPYYSNHVAHHFQSIAGLLSMTDALSGTDHSDPVSYVLLPKFNSESFSLYDWTTGVLSLVIQSYEDQLQLLQLQQRQRQRRGLDRDGDAGGDADDGVSADRVSVLYASQFESMFAGNTDDASQAAPQLVCFRELRLLGQADAFQGLFVDSSSHERFRQRAYNTLLSNSSMVSLDTVTSKVEGAFFGLTTHKTNQYKLKVTVILRWFNRRIVNLPALHRVLIESGVVDVEWLNSQEKSRWRHLEQMSLQEQIALFKETDLLIGAHGGAFANAALFMEPHSVMIEIMPSRFLDPSFRQMAHQAKLVLHTMFVTNHNQSSNCGAFGPECLDGSLLDGGGMSCFGLRNCDVSVDVAWFEALVELSAHHIRANKRKQYWTAL